MKNTIKALLVRVFGNLNQARSAKVHLLIIALVALIGFGAVSCGDDDGGGVLGNTITSGAEVVYDSSIGNSTEAKNATDFGFYNDFWDLHPTLKPLSYFSDGSPSVKVEINKVTIILGTPKSDFLTNLSFEAAEFEGGITVSPGNANYTGIEEFFTSDYKYKLVCMKDGYTFVYLYYVDRDVTIKGSHHDKSGKYTNEYNVSLKKGWNYFILSYKINTKTWTYTSSTTQPSGFKWTVLDYNYNYRWDY